MEKQNIKRLFFGMVIEAPWPEKMPVGRVLNPECRHMTLAFLGNVHWPDVEALLPALPLPSLRVGLVGRSDRCLFLPPRHPRVVSWHADWRGPAAAQLMAYQQELVAYLRQANYTLDERPFLPHITIARSPFDEKHWRKAFVPLPLMAHTLHLFESVGNLIYTPVWTHHLRAPFEELSHTADIAFRIRAETMQQLGFHAQTALCFKAPELLSYLVDIPEDSSLDDIIIALNDSVTRADCDFGCPFKAVSFHGDVSKDADGLLTWEMIIDV